MGIIFYDCFSPFLGELILRPKVSKNLFPTQPPLWGFWDIYQSIFVTEGNPLGLRNSPMRSAQTTRA